MADIWLQRFFVNTAKNKNVSVQTQDCTLQGTQWICSRAEKGLGFTQAPWQELRCHMLPVPYVQEIRAHMDQTHTLLEDSPQLHTQPLLF